MTNNAGKDAPMRMSTKKLVRLRHIALLINSIIANAIPNAKQHGAHIIIKINFKIFMSEL